MSAVRTPPTAGRLRILVVMRHGGYVRNYDSVLRELAERGHDLTVAFEAPKAKLLGETGALLELIAEHPHVRQIVLPSLKGSRPHRRARGLRLALDYLRYLGPRFRDAAALRARAREMVPAPLRLAERLPGTLPARGLAWGLRGRRAPQRRSGPARRGVAQAPAGRACSSRRSFSSAACRPTCCAPRRRSACRPDCSSRAGTTSRTRV